MSTKKISNLICYIYHFCHLFTICWKKSCLLYLPEFEKFQATAKFSCCYIDDAKTGMRGVVLAGGHLAVGKSGNKLAVNTTLLYDLNSKVKRWTAFKQLPIALGSFQPQFKTFKLPFPAVSIQKWKELGNLVMAGYAMINPCVVMRVSINNIYLNWVFFKKCNNIYLNWVFFKKFNNVSTIIIWTGYSLRNATLSQQ